MRAPAPGGSPGFSAVEALVVLLLLGLLLPSGWKVFAQHREAVLRLARQAEALETVRTLAWLLSEELGGGRAHEDWIPSDSDSVPLRAFRGIGVVAGGGAAPGELRVCYSGLRSPDPGKDSVLSLGSDGVWRSSALRHRVFVAPGCPGVDGGVMERWTLEPPPPPPLLARVFESGVYALSQGALRYRRGFGGRQPLTPPVLEGGEFWAGRPPAPALAWEVAVPPGGGAAGVAWRGEVW